MPEKGEPTFADPVRQADEALRRSEERLRLVLAETETGTWDWDVRTNQVRWSENLGPIHGREPGWHPATYEDFLSVVHPDDRARVGAAVEEAVANGTGYELELRTAPRDGSWHWLWTRASMVTDADGRPVQLVGITRDVSERKLAEEARELLVQVTELLLRSLDHERTLWELATLCAHRIADWCSVELLGPDGALANVAVAHVDPARVRLAAGLRDRYPLDLLASTGPANVVRTGQAELYAEISDDMLQAAARDPGQLEIWRTLGLRSAMVVPLTVRGTTLGTITLASAESGRRYGELDLALASELGRRAALAVDNARLHRSELEARESAERSRDLNVRLQAVTEALTTTLTQEEVMAVVTDAGVAALDADGCRLYRREGDELVLLGSAGYPEQLVRRWARIALDCDDPASEVARSRRPLALGTARELDARFPELRAVREITGDTAVLAAPLEAFDGLLGVLAFTFRRAQAVDVDERALALTIAWQCAQALERARLYDAERAARAAAERAAERTERLHAVTAALAPAVTVTDVAAVLVAEACRSVGAPAGWVGLSAEDDPHTLRLAAADGFPPAIVGAYERLAVDAPLPGPDAFRTGTPIWLESAADVSARYPAIADEYSTAGHEALAVLPIVLGAQPAGFLTLAFSEWRAFGLEDRLLLATIVRQCEQSFERARLYEREHHVAVTLQQSMLPDRLPALAGAMLAARYLPGTEGLQVGGDWYDAIELGEERVGVVVGDVVGKGVRAASTMGQLRQALRVYAREGRKPRGAIRRLNELIEGPSTSFATLVFLVADLASGVCRYTNAGHLPPIVRRRDGTVELLDRPGSLPVGIGPASYRHELLTLEQGDLVLLYTDGLVERRDRPLETGLELLVQAVERAPDEPEFLLDALLAALVGDRREDDIALIALRRDLDE